MIDTKRCRRLAWSFVNYKGNKPWVLLELDKKLEKLSVIILANAAKKGLEDYGILSSIYRGGGASPAPGNLLFVIQIIGRLISKLFQANGIKPVEKRVV